MREAKVARKTTETDIEVSVNVDGTGKYDIETGIGSRNGSRPSPRTPG